MRLSFNPNRFDSPIFFLSLAAIIAHKDALEAVSWITPPPLLLDLKSFGRFNISTSQSSTWVSNSVQDGLVSHSIPLTPSPLEIRSAKIDGPLVFVGKYPKNIGDCQCVIPGIMTLSISFNMVSIDSPYLGGFFFRLDLMSPGET